MKTEPRSKSPLGKDTPGEESGRDSVEKPVVEPKDSAWRNIDRVFVVGRQIPERGWRQAIHTPGGISIATHLSLQISAIEFERIQSETPNFCCIATPKSSNEKPSR